jgi:hypothetical protein
MIGLLDLFNENRQMRVEASGVMIVEYVQVDTVPAAIDER